VIFSADVGFKYPVYTQTASTGWRCGRPIAVARWSCPVGEVKYVEPAIG